jgi:hypothetical protein
LLQSTTRTGSHASLNLLTLGFQYCGSKECHLLALLCAVQDFGVVEIAYPNPDHPRRIGFAFLDKHEQRAAGAAGPSACGAWRAATGSATTSAAPTSTRR